MKKCFILNVDKQERKLIYLDNAATTIHKPKVVINAVTQAMLSNGNASRGAHGVSLKAASSVFEARKTISDFFNCGSPERVIFTANSTEALNIAIYGLLSSGQHAVSTDLEHNSVLRPLYNLEESGLKVDFIHADSMGNVDYSEFENLITTKTKAVVCTHASNLTGNLLDIRKIGKIAHSKGALMIVDTSQTAGNHIINMKDMSIDVLCFTGHKGLFGPQGTGGLCIAEDVEIRPFIRGGTGVQSYNKNQPDTYPERLEAGTLNSHGIAGLNAAIKYINEVGIENIYAKENSLMRQFYNGIKKINGVTVYGDFSADALSNRTAIVSLNIRDYDSAMVSDVLATEYGIATRPGAHCAPRMHYALHTEKQGAVRFSFGFFNTEEEVNSAVEAVRKIAE